MCAKTKAEKNIERKSASVRILSIRTKQCGDDRRAFFRMFTYSPLSICAGGYGVRDKESPRGEVLIGGSVIADGYFKCQSEEESNAFFLDPNGKKWFRTGDIGQVNLTTNTISLIDR